MRGQHVASNHCIVSGESTCFTSLAWFNCFVPFVPRGLLKHLSGLEQRHCSLSGHSKGILSLLLDHWQLQVNDTRSWSLSSLTLPTICILEAAVDAVVIAAESTLGLQQLVFLVQEVQTVVTWQSTNSELVGHFGPLLPISCYSLVQLSGLREQFRQQPERTAAQHLVLHFTFARQKIKMQNNKRKSTRLALVCCENIQTYT